MKQPTPLWRRVVASCVTWTLAFGQIVPAYAASTDISDVPLAVKNQVPPNIVMTLDDSGSMQWEFLPEDTMGLSMWLYPRPASPYLGSTFLNVVPNFNENNVHNFFGRSSHNNKLYYNPNVTYRPWSNADGSLWPNANPTAAYYNPANPGTGSLNLRAQRTDDAIWFSDGNTGSRSDFVCDPSPCGANHTFWPITYYKYKGAGNVLSRGSYDKVEITSMTPPAMTFEYTITNDDGTTTTATRTRDEEIQNFANWFTYHRSRISTSRAAIGRAFSALDQTPRVGFATINTGAKTIDGVASPGTMVKGVRPFTGADRTGFFSSLYNAVINADDTPLRQAMDDVGVYFSRTDNLGPWGANPGVGGGSQLACRQNFHIMMTDGYWNDAAARTAAARNNVDNTNGATHISAPDPITGATTSYSYTPANPWSDSYSNTLADVAMYYWVRDLRPDMPNKVFTNQVDNAFWQHVSVLGVALGVFGTIPKATVDAAFSTPYPTINWPNPTASNGAKIDDLAHAAVNGRGAFFSAGDSEELAQSLSEALDNVASRTSAGAAIGITSANILSGDNTLFASSYLPGFTWTGDLGSYQIDVTTGIPTATPNWLAQAQLDARSAASRFIATYSGTTGASQGRQFQPASATTATKLSTAQQALLNTPVSPPGTSDGAAVVRYLRGERTGEVSGLYRARTHLLGDIINAQPIVVRPPEARYADAGYAAFKTAKSTRRQIVLQGANDGMLHAFDAGTAKNGAVAGTPGTGAELWAYVPSLLLPALNNLSRKVGYTHKAYVDATPVVGDVDFNKTSAASGAPDWRTIAVGGLGKGGRGFYALDVSETTAANEAAVTTKVLWEFPNSATPAAVKANIGYSFGRPIITKTKAAGWVVLVTSGMNNGTDSAGDGRGYLFVLDARTGALIRAIDTGAGTAADPANLAHVAGYVESGEVDNTVEYVYGGDIRGNVWRFDLTAASSASWNVRKLATLVDGSGAYQPVTTEPELAKIKVNGADKRFVYVGTGLLLGDKDIPGVSGANAWSSQTQSIYGLVDDLSAAPLVSPLRASLQQQTLTTNADGSRTATANTVDFATKRGWYLDFPAAGERVNNAPALGAGALVVVTNVPNSDPCTLGGSSYFNVLDYKTGGYRDGTPSSPSSIRFAQGMASAPVLVRVPSGSIVGLVRLTDASIKATTVPTSGGAAVTKRRSWRELLQ
ncbi:MAG TPA: PilC/PilY family type IV pilus protein [Burkholderiales bacterium]|nr:PilC/PilY family type IV pilus protein [Burkholderiales bacterium]